jgi:6-phosphogluconolactonase (cycloisomerase 2 family)
MNTNLNIIVAFPLAFCVFTGCGSASSEEAATTQSAAQSLSSDHVQGAVFTLSNAATGNSVVAFWRSRNGMLEAAGQYPTGGLGLGASLGSQGALALDESGRFLLAVNAGSNEISSFAVNGTTLKLMSKVPSGGVQPTSVAVRDQVVYALNAGQTSNISGLRLHEDGQLTPIAASTRLLSAAMPGPAQVAIAPFDLGVVVTEKGTSLIDTFTLMRDGTLSAADPQPSSGMTPYGFAFTPDGTLVVSDATPGAVSAYAVGRSGALTTLAAAVPDMQVAPCWVAVTADGEFAYTANAHSSSISGYRVGRHGALTLLDASGVTASTGANSTPLDMAIDHQSHLYVVDGGNHAIVEFSVGTMGELTMIGTQAGLPTTAVGIVAE